MADLKTQPSSSNVDDFLNSVADEQQRADSFALVDIMRKETNAEPVMWGGSIIGFGHYHYVYESGREGDWFLTGFSPRKGKISVYLMNGFSKAADLLGQLGPHKTGKSCLYIKRLADIDESVLRTMIRLSVAYLNNKE